MTPETMTRIEWGNHRWVNDWNEAPCCPVCGGIQPGNHHIERPGISYGHVPGCELQASLDAQRPETAGIMPMPEIRVGDTIVHGRPREPVQFMYRVTEYERKAWQDDPNVVAVLAPLWRREGNQS